MFAEHIVDVDVGANRAVLLQMSYLDHGLTDHVEHQPQFPSANGQYRIADSRIF